MNIFIVETPMELVSAIEARHHFPEEESILFIHSFYPKTIFLSLLEKDNWTVRTVFYQDKPVDWSNPQQTKREQFRLRMTLGKIIRIAGDANYLFINYFRAHMRHVINHLKHRNLILIEGGTDAIGTNALRYIPMTQEMGSRKLSWWRLVKRYFRKRYFDLDTLEVPSVTFFSAYDLEVRPGDRLIKNDYRYIKQWAGHQCKSDEVYFLGQPLSEDGYMDRECFFTYMGQIRDYLGAENIIFLPHPRQSKEIVCELEKKFGFQVRKFTLPIEFQMLLGNEIPKALTGLWSSALINCNTFFGDNLPIKAFYLEPHDLLIKHEYVEDVYKYMQKISCQTFDVVKLRTVFNDDNTRTKKIIQQQ